VYWKDFKGNHCDVCNIGVEGRMEFALKNLLLQRQFGIADVLVII
jgi:hypothetical protein